MMMVSAGYGIGIGFESQLSLYRYPDVTLTVQPRPSINLLKNCPSPRAKSDTLQWVTFRCAAYAKHRSMRI